MSWKTSLGGIKMTIISVINQKGGVGKSTLAFHLSVALHKMKERVLMIDMDPQGHLSMGFGIDKDNLSKTIFNVLDIRDQNGMNIEEAAINISKNLTLIPANIELTTLDIVLAQRNGRESRLRQALTQAVLDKYTYVIIDCPPNLGLLTINALVASEYVVVPFDTSYYAFDGINYLNSTLDMLHNKINHQLHVRYLLNNIDMRVTSNKNFIKNIRKRFGEKMFKNYVRKSAHFEEAIRNKVSVFRLEKATAAQRDITQITKEIVDWTTKPIKFLSKSELRKASYSLKGNHKEIKFRMRNPYARDVRITGSFNNWDPQGSTLSKVGEDGVWEAVIPLKKGKHSYKFIVDGQWQEDYSNTNREEVYHGIYNSVMEVK